MEVEKEKLDLEKRRMKAEVMLSEVQAEAKDDKKRLNWLRSGLLRGIWKELHAKFDEIPNKRESKLYYLPKW